MVKIGVLVIGGLMVVAGLGGVYDFLRYSAEQRERAPLFSKIFVLGAVLFVATGGIVVYSGFKSQSYPFALVALANGIGIIAVVAEWRMRRKMNIGLC